MQGQGSGKVDGRRRLAHTALLVGDDDHTGLLRAWQTLAGAAQSLHRELGSTTDRSVIHRGRCFT